MAQIKLLQNMIPTVADIDAKTCILKAETRLLAKLRKLAEARDVEASALSEALNKCEDAVKEVLARNGIMAEDDAA